MISILRVWLKRLHLRILKDVPAHYVLIIVSPAHRLARSVSSGFENLFKPFFGILFKLAPSAGYWFAFTADLIYVAG